jgi:hypothetical protein
MVDPLWTPSLFFLSFTSDCGSDVGGEWSVIGHELLVWDVVHSWTVATMKTTRKDVADRNGEIERAILRDTFYDGESGIVRVFPLDYAQLRKQAFRPMWCIGFSFCFVLFSFFLSGADPSWHLIMLCYMMLLFIMCWYSIRLQLRNNDSQHVALTTTGIRYDSRNSAFFRATMHVSSFCCLGVGFFCSSSAIGHTCAL